MIGKVIRMNRTRRHSPAARARSTRVAQLGSSVFALTRYIVDADPYGLVAEAEREILSLSDYALAVKSAGVEPGEKVEAYGVRNLHGRDLADWQAEMLAVAARAPRMQSPLIHIILSLREGEGWTAHERDETLRIVVETLGLSAASSSGPSIRTRKTPIFICRSSGLIQRPAIVPAPTG